MTERKTIWIQRNKETNSLTVSASWFDYPYEGKFTKAEANELFECIKQAINAKWPNIEINPWLDAKHGILD